MACPFSRTPEEGPGTQVVVAADPDLAGVSGSYFCNSKVADNRLSRVARDAEAAERLWVLSRELLDLTP